MEAETAALRQALETLDLLEQQLGEAGYDPYPYTYPSHVRDLRAMLLAKLRAHESALWTLAGLPEVPRGRP